MDALPGVASRGLLLASGGVKIAVPLDTSPFASTSSPINGLSNKLFIMLLLEAISIIQSPASITLFILPLGSSTLAIVAACSTIDLYIHHNIQ